MKCKILAIVLNLWNDAYTWKHLNLSFIESTIKTGGNSIKWMRESLTFFSFFSLCCGFYFDFGDDGSFTAKRKAKQKVRQKGNNILFWKQILLGKIIQVTKFLHSPFFLAFTFSFFHSFFSFSSLLFSFTFPLFTSTHALHFSFRALFSHSFLKKPKEKANLMHKYITSTLLPLTPR